MPWRRLLLSMLVALPVLLVLLGLGTWQAQRLAWKTDLLARIAAAEAAPPALLGPAAPPIYARVLATGHFDHGREALLGAEVRGTVLGGHLLTPLIRADGAPPVLVDRGWVPFARTSVSILRPEGEVQVTGYVRQGETAGLFAAQDDGPGRRFYTFDPAAIGQALGLAEVAPFGLVALAAPGGVAAGVLPVPAQTLPRPNNPHLGYAITWYGLAAALVGVVLAFALRRRPPPASDAPAGPPGTSAKKR